MGLKGANICEVEREDGEKYLVTIPAKFNKVLWISKGTLTIIFIIYNILGMFLIVETFTNVDWGASKVKGRVSHVLYEQQIAHLQRIKNWPKKWMKNAKENEKDETKMGQEHEEGDSDESVDLPDNPNWRREEEFSEDEYSI